MNVKPIGYAALIERHGLDVLAPAVSCHLLERGRRHTRVEDGRRDEFYPPRDDPGEDWTDHLAFALKHEGMNLEVLAALFRVVPKKELLDWISASPTGRYARITWFLFEWLTDRRLPLEAVTQGNYVPVLDEETYYALAPNRGAVRMPRQRVLNNLPGTRDYCPLVRRTGTLASFEAEKFDEQATRQVNRFPVDLVYRATTFLYLKETKSSYAIEHLTADQRRTARFVSLLRQAGTLECFGETDLVRLQNAIVDERYGARSFRDFQNYVGQSLGPSRELVHYVPPQPGSLRLLMEGWKTCCKNLLAGGVHPVVAATVAGYGFVFLHPFEDGNGRLHRFLIHHVLAATRFGPSGLVLPVSATMLKQMSRYDASLEAYSREVGRHVEYRLDEQGAMRVLNETTSFYRYPDLTLQAEALFGFIRDTLKTELVAELEYLAAFDRARHRMKTAVDMPDRRQDLFLRACLQGKGRLSKNKRAQFKELTDSECARLERIVRTAVKALRSDRDEP